MAARDIAIIGAGITGLAAAIALRRQDFRVVVYERFAQSLPIGSGLLIQPTGLAALGRLGLRGRIESLGARIDRLAGETIGGTTIFNLNYADLAPCYYAIGIHRAALHGTLWAEFETCGADLETVVDVCEAVTGPAGRIQTIDRQGRTLPAADLLIDASGTNSALAMAARSRPARAFRYGAVWATVPDIDYKPGALSQRYEAARKMMGYLPIGRLEPEGGSLAALFWSLKTADYDAWVENFESWRHEASDYWPALGDVIDRLEGPRDFTLAKYAHATLRRPYRESLAFAGDAAHATSPQLGQGANQGLIDAIVLAGALSRTADIQTALQLYAETRRQHVRFYQRASAIMTPLFQSDQVVLPYMRDLTFDRLRLVPYLHREMLRTLGGLKNGLFSWREPEDLLDPLLNESVSAEPLDVRSR